MVRSNHVLIKSQIFSTLINPKAAGILPFPGAFFINGHVLVNGTPDIENQVKLVTGSCRHSIKCVGDFILKHPLIIPAFQHFPPTTTFESVAKSCWCSPGLLKSMILTFARRNSNNGTKSAPHFHAARKGRG